MIGALLEIDPNLVRPGFTPLLVLVGLMIALTLLYLSLRRQLRKIHLPYRDEVEEVEEPAQDDAIEVEDSHHDHLGHDGDNPPAGSGDRRPGDQRPGDQN